MAADIRLQDHPQKQLTWKQMTLLGGSGRDSPTPAISGRQKAKLEYRQDTDDQSIGDLTPCDFAGEPVSVLKNYGEPLGQSTADRDSQKLESLVGAPVSNSTAR